MNNTPNRPSVLVTNDDGINSLFLKTLVEALSEKFEVTVVAPKDERSWTGRGFTRYGTLSLTRGPESNWYALSGSPSDCVNVGIGHLVEKRPDVVVSGINLGFNMSLPLVTTSGTVAGALEGALWGLPAIASSFHIPFDVFEAVKAGHGKLESPLRDALEVSAQKTAEYALKLVSSKSEGTKVHNLNFPSTMSADTPLRQVLLSNMRLGNLFTQTAPDEYSFSFPTRQEPIFMDERTDFGALKQEDASICILDFDKLSTAS